MSSYECVSKWWGPKTIHWLRTKNVSTNNTTIYSFLGAGGGGFEILRDTRTRQQVVLYNLDLPPNQDASHKWRFRLKFPYNEKIKKSWWWRLYPGWMVDQNVSCKSSPLLKVHPFSDWTSEVTKQNEMLKMLNISNRFPREVVKVFFLRINLNTVPLGQTKEHNHSEASAASMSNLE